MQWSEVVDDVTCGDSQNQGVKETDAFLAVMSSDVGRGWTGYCTFSTLKELEELVTEVQLHNDFEQYCTVTVYNRSGEEVRYKPEAKLVWL